MSFKIIHLIFILGVLLHVFVMQVNKILKTSEGVSYISLANDFKTLDFSNIGVSGPGFLYSFFIAGIDYFIDNPLLSGFIVNTILLIISGILLFKLGKKYLHPTYNILLIILFFLSSSILEYNANISVENIYIPIFLGLILSLESLIKETSIKSMSMKVDGINIKVSNNLDIFKKSVLVGFILSLLYFTINESYIYLISIFFILFYLLFLKKLSFSVLFLSFSTILITFLLFISPYIYHIHNITGEWKITNKLPLNILKNDTTIDLEKLKYTLNENKDKFISQNNNNLLDYLNNNTDELKGVFIQNQKEFWINLLPNTLIGDAFKSYNDRSFIFYQSKIYLFLIFTPYLFLIYGLYKLLFTRIVKITEKRNLLILITPLFLISLIFFSLFLVQEKYFIIFLPLALLIISFGAQNLLQSEEELFSAIKYLVITSLFIFIYLQGSLHYYTYNKFNDIKYQIKKEASEWIVSEGIKDVKIMEKSPVVAYYSNILSVYEIPFTDNIEHLIEYAKHNKIDYLVVDTIDFKKYRPDLNFILDSNYKHKNLEKVHEVKKPGEKVILYKIKY